MSRLTLYAFILLALCGSTLAAQDDSAAPADPKAATESSEAKDEMPAATETQTASDSAQSDQESTKETEDGKENSGTRAGSLFQLVLFVFLVLYGLHAIFVTRKQKTLTLEDPEFRLFSRNGSSDTIWTFLLVTCFLPLGITVISVASDSITPAELMARNATVQNETAQTNLPLHAAFLLWGLAKSVFVLMITLEISYLYNSLSAKWRPMITSALVLDILSFLVFTTLLPQDNRTPSSATWVTMSLMGLVGTASFLSSFLTILYTRGYEQYYSYKHGLNPPDQMAGAKQLYSNAEIQKFLDKADSPEGRATSNLETDSNAEPLGSSTVG